MKHSTERILTTHVGSLPRPTELISLLQAKDHQDDAVMGLITMPSSSKR